MEEDTGTAPSAAEVAQYAAGSRQGKKRRLAVEGQGDGEGGRQRGGGRGEETGVGGWGQARTQGGQAGGDGAGTADDSAKPARTAPPAAAAPAAVPLKGDPSFHAARRTLPLSAHRAAIAQAVRASASVVLCGETGSGKTTQVPQLLLEAGLLPTVYLPSSRAPGQGGSEGSGGKQHTYAQQLQAVVTQPRRVAAITLAKRVACEVGCPLGGAVGYTVRFDDVSGPGTRLRYVTDGMLLREAITDPLLSKIGVVVLDECHERSLNTDVLFGVVKRAQLARANGRARAPPATTGGSSTAGGASAVVHAAGHTLPPLKIIVMSATLDIDLFASYFGRSPRAVTGPDHGGGGDHEHKGEGKEEEGGRVSVLSIPGRSFPVTLYYAPEPVEDYCAAAVTTVLQIAVSARAEAGDILVFLPGQEEIEDVAAVLKSKDSMLALVGAQGSGDQGETRESSASAPAPAPLGLTVVPLYASLSPEAQLLAFDPPPKGTRKVILSTNIAETSVTISGVRYVVDSGKVKVRSSINSAHAPVGGEGAAATGLKGAGGRPVGVTLESLASVDVSQSQAIQRAGRAGREAPGECYRLYTEEAYEGLPVSPAPEIARVNLSSVLLQLLGMGLPGTHALAFPWLEPPPVASLRSSLCLLRDLGAVASCPVLSTGGVGGTGSTAPGIPHHTAAAGALPGLPAPLSLPGAKAVEFGLTDTGKVMSALPLDPILTSLLLACLQEGVGALGLSLVAVCAGESPFVHPGRDKESAAAAARKAFISLEGDHLTLLNVLLGFERVVAGAAKEVSANMGRDMLAAHGFQGGGKHGSRHAAHAPAAAAAHGAQSGAVEVQGVKVITMMEDDDPAGSTAAADAAEEEDPVPVVASGKDDAASLASNPRAPASRSAATGATAASGARGLAEAQGILYRWAGRNARARSDSPEGSNLQALTGVRSCMDVLISCGMVVIRAAAAAEDASMVRSGTGGAPGAQGVSPKAGAAAKKAARIFTAAVGKRVSTWCWDHFTSFRALRQAVSVRDQLSTQCHVLGLALATSHAHAGRGTGVATEGPSDADRLRRALLAGCFLNVARRVPGAEAGARPQYRTLVGSITCAIHPSSALVVAHAHARNKAAATAAAAVRAGRVLTSTGPLPGPAAAGGAAWSQAGAGVRAGGGLPEELGGYPDTVIFSELVQTQGSQASAGKEGSDVVGSRVVGSQGLGLGGWKGEQGAGGPKVYMRTVTRVETAWLSAIRPDFFASVH